MIDPTFRNINMLFVCSLKNSSNDPTKDSLDKYDMPLAEIKDFNALIGSKPFLDQPAKNKQEMYETLAEMLRNSYFTKGNILDYFYHQNIINISIMSFV